MPSKLICVRSGHFLHHSFIPMIYLLFFIPEALSCCSSLSSSQVVRIVFLSCLSIQPECRALYSSSLILSSFASLLNRSAVWNRSYPLCHSFNSSGGSVLLISSSILILSRSCSIPSIYSRSVVQIISFFFLLYLVLNGVLWLSFLF